MKDDDQKERIVSTIIFNYNNGLLKEVSTVLSTATDALVVNPVAIPLSGISSIAFEYTNEYDARKKLLSLFDAGYDYDVKDVERTCSIHQNHLRRARNHLIEKVLMLPQTSFFDLEEIIWRCGVAINKQVDKNPNVSGKNLGDNIYAKLRTIDLEKDNPSLFN